MSLHTVDEERTMKTLDWKSSVMWTALSLLFLLLALIVGPAPALAQGPDAVLYELTENMKFTSGKMVHRKATSELMGTANAGTPLCPLPVGAPPCTINATGSDNINLATGLGKFGGTFTVVVQGDNPADSPEYVIAKGKFHGKMDFSPAILAGVPLGTVVGKMVLDGGGTHSFTGTFRLPFVLDAATVDSAKPGDSLFPLQQGLLYFFGDGDPADARVAALLGWGALPLTPFPKAFYTDKCPGGVASCTRPLYLGDGGLSPAAASEYGLGYPTVKFEIKF
jgi:hypothetical protein